MRPRFLICSTLALSFCASLALGQYPGGSNPPAGGYHSSTGIAIGAVAAAGAGVAYLVVHNHNRGAVTGCLLPSGTESNMLLNDKKGTYTLINNDSVPLKTGDRVALRGKRIRQNSGELAFEVHGLAKDYGPCEP
jgi:hypothetical protein